LNIIEKNGHCINCGNIISYDINNVFCKRCYYNISSPQFNLIKGIYCHDCGSQNSKISNYYPICLKCKPFDRNDNSIDGNYINGLNEFNSSESKKIIPLWKYEPYTKRLDLNNKLTLKRIKTLDAIKIIENTSELKTTNIFDNTPKSNRRIMNALKAWKKGIYIPPPSILVKDPVSIYDGNHRILAAHFVQSKYISCYV